MHAPSMRTLSDLTYHTSYTALERFISFLLEFLIIFLLTKVCCSGCDDVMSRTTTSELTLLTPVNTPWVVIDTGAEPATDD